MEDAVLEVSEKLNDSENIVISSKDETMPRSAKAFPESCSESVDSSHDSLVSLELVEMVKSKIDLLLAKGELLQDKSTALASRWRAAMMMVGNTKLPKNGLSDMIQMLFRLTKMQDDQIDLFQRVDSESQPILACISASSHLQTTLSKSNLFESQKVKRASMLSFSRKRTDAEISVELEKQPPTNQIGATPVGTFPVASKNFSKVPKEVADANLPKPELMRLSTVYELIETELDYGKDLTTMLQVFNFIDAL